LIIDYNHSLDINWNSSGSRASSLWCLLEKNDFEIL